MKLNFLNVDAPGEAELAHITCSGELEHRFFQLKSRGVWVASRGTDVLSCGSGWC